MVSKYATHSETQFSEFYSNFGRVSDALNHQLGNLENPLCEIQAKTNGGNKVSSYSSPSSSSSSSSSSSGSGSSKEASKKRKSDGKPPVKSDINFGKLYDPNYRLNDQERTYIRRQQKCLSYQVVKFSPEHLSECPERKKFLAKKVSNHSNTQVAVLFSTLNEIVTNASSNSRTINEKEETVIFDGDIEFLNAFNELDNFIIHDNDEIELDTNNNFFNKNIFSHFNQFYFN